MSVIAVPTLLLPAAGQLPDTQTDTQCPTIAFSLGCLNCKFGPQTERKSGKFRANTGYKFDYCGKPWRFRRYGRGGDVTAVANDKTWGRFTSGRFTTKITSENGKLSTIGCHLPPKSTNVWTLQTHTEPTPCRSSLYRRRHPTLMPDPHGLGSNLC